MPVIEIPYSPRKAFVPYHERKQRNACMVCHRRAGKTVSAVNDDIRDSLISKHWETGLPLERFRAAYIAPTYAQAKAVAWDYVKHYASAIPGVRFNEAELRADFPNGSRYRLLGAENYDSLRGIYLDKCTMDEPADQDPRAWQEVIRPALTDRKGRVTFIGTPKGRNSFYDIHKVAENDPAGWFSLVLKSSETGLLDPAELAMARRDMTEDSYLQEFECSFDAAVTGTYYGKEMKEMEESGRVTSVPHDPHLLVHTSWDLGVDDSTAIVFWQIYGKEYRIIDYFESAGQPLGFYVSEIRKRAYIYGEHFFPHDVRATELQTAKTRVEALRSLGLEPAIAPNHLVADGITTVRRVLPSVWIDAGKCARLVECLKLYRRQWNEKNKIWSQRPVHDWTSHGADAVRCFAMAYADDIIMEEDFAKEGSLNGFRSGRNDTTGY